MVEDEPKIFKKDSLKRCFDLPVFMWTKQLGGRSGAESLVEPLRHDQVRSGTCEKSARHTTIPEVLFREPYDFIRAPCNLSRIQNFAIYQDFPIETQLL